MAEYQHIGYYNDKEDIEALFNATRDEVVDYWKTKYGQFYEDDDEVRDGFDFDNDALGEDGDEFIITRDVPNSVEDIREDSFIDIYKKLPVLDRKGKPIHKGDTVKWYDPCPEGDKVSRYEVYEEPTEDMVKLWSEYGECEALPEECEVVKKVNKKK